MMRRIENRIVNW